MDAPPRLLPTMGSRTTLLWAMTPMTLVVNLLETQELLRMGSEVEVTDAIAIWCHSEEPVTAD